MGTAGKNDLYKHIQPELSDEQVEQRYLNEQLEGIVAYTKPLILKLGLLFMLFAIPDFFVLEGHPVYLTILLIRLLYFCSLYFLYNRISTFTSHKILTRWLTAYKGFASMAFLAIFALYRSPDVIIQSLGVITLLLVFYMLPNRWINMVLISFATTIGFIALSLGRFSSAPMQVAAVGVYMNLTAVVLAVNSYHNHKEKRQQFVRQKNLTYLSLTDELTGLYNRKKFNRTLTQWKEEAAENEIKLSLIVLDVDNFKHINDSLGHLAGDEVLREMGAIIKNNVRKKDVASRWGGDEFSILLPDTNREEALVLGDRLKKAVTEHVYSEVEGITCSLGVSSLKEDDDESSLLQRADRNMYMDKLSSDDIKRDEHIKNISP